MEFEGHQMHKLSDHWVFDLTTFIGYHIETKNNVVVAYHKAFMVIRSKNSDTYGFYKYMNVPKRVLRRSVCIIQKYRKEALLEDAGR